MILLVSQRLRRIEQFSPTRTSLPYLTVVGNTSMRYITETLRATRGDGSSNESVEVLATAGSVSRKTCWKQDFGLRVDNTS